MSNQTNSALDSASAEKPLQSTATASNSKRKASSTEASNQVAHFTTRNPSWTYLKLQLVYQPGTPTAIKNQPLDVLTARTYLTSAFSQFLGISGTAISVDILKIDSPAFTAATVSPDMNPQKDVWIRVPRQDARAVVTALSSWVGNNKSVQNAGSVAWRVCAKGNFLGALVAGSGGNLFIPA
ncbi:hypothetical protein MAP00_007068 [Monascus purpureus]|nr:hypothetical protein MAP00_007068 [Monascus purpureus]